MIGDDDIAALVRAFLFELVNASGDVVASLTSLTPSSFGTASPALVFDHGDPSTSTSSFIAWTNDAPAYPDRLLMAGPATASERTGVEQYLTPLNTNGLNAYATDIVSGGDAGLSLTATATGDGLASLYGTSGGFQNAIDVARVGGVGYIDVRPKDALRLNGRTARVEVVRYDKAATAVVNPLVVAATAMPGATSTAAYKVGDVVDVTAFFDFTLQVAGAGTAVGELYVDGVAQTAQALYLPAIVGARAIIGQQWTYTIPNSGNHTFDLRVRISALGATYKCEQIHTTLKVRGYGTV